MLNAFLQTIGFDSRLDETPRQRERASQIPFSNVPRLLDPQS